MQKAAPSLYRRSSRQNLFRRGFSRKELFRATAAALALLVAALLVALPRAAQAQASGNAPPENTPPGEEAVRVNPALLEEEWPARWIEHPEAPPYGYGVYHFRKTFSLEEAPAEAFPVHVSADNRYQLFVNGERVGFGPARSDLRRWRFETYDLAPFLQEGKNAIAAVVWNAGEHRPLSQITHRTGLVVQGNTEAESVVNTGTGGSSAWQVTENEGYAPVAFRDNDPRLDWLYYVAGATDSLDAAKYPWGWQTLGYEERPGYDAGRWQRAFPLDHAAPQGYETHQAWRLTPRPVAKLSVAPQRFERVARMNAPALSEAEAQAFATGEGSLSIPANAEATLLLDQGVLTTGHPVLEVSGGEGATVRLTYAEALYGEDRQKGRRDQIEGKEPLGVYDVFMPDGGEGRTFRPLWTRSWRWLELGVETAGEPLRLGSLRSHRVAYPAEQKGAFASSGAAPDSNALSDTLAQVWDMGWRTLHLNAQETFVSDLAWERVQYVGDTKVQALAWLYQTTGDRLVEEALRLFDASRLPNGLTQSRYPAWLEQTTPVYSLAWVTMVHDYWMHRRSGALVREMLPGMRAVLGWFERQREETASGLVPASMRDFRNRGYFQRRAENYPEADSSSREAVMPSLTYAMALQEAAELFDAHGEAREAEAYRAEANEIIEIARECCYSAERGAFADSPNEVIYSWSTNTLALLTGALPPGEDPQALMRWVLDRSGEMPAHGRFFYYRLLMAEALRKTGMGEEYLRHLDTWKHMVEMRLTTLGERPGGHRSEAHPWTASPMYDLQATVAGVTPAAPGFREVRVAPALGPLRSVEATVPHPDGLIEVAFEKEDGVLRGRVRLPEGVTGTLQWGGKTQPLRGGAQKVRLQK